MDGQDTKVVCSETPNSEGTTQGRDAGVDALKHAVCCDSVLLLTSRLLLDVGNTARDIFGVDDITTTLAELEFVLKLLTLIVKPLCNLFPAERKLPRAVSNIEDLERMLGRDFAGNRERPAARSRNRATSLVTKGRFSYTSSFTTRKTYVDVDVNPIIPRMGAPSSSAIFAFMSTCTPVPWASMNCGDTRERKNGFQYGVTYTGTSRRRGTRHLSRFAAHGELRLRVASRLHVCELVGALLAQVIEAASEHDFGLARQEGVTSNLDRLECSRAVRLFER